MLIRPHPSIRIALLRDCHALTDTHDSCLANIQVAPLAIAAQ